MKREIVRRKPVITWMVRKPYHMNYSWRSGEYYGRMTTFLERSE